MKQKSMNILLYDKIKKYKQTIEELYQELDREPTRDEIQQVLDFDISQVENMEIEEKEETDLELLVRISIANNNLRKARENKGFEQKEVSRLLGWTDQKYSHIERCYQYPSEAEQKAIANLFEKPQEELFPKWLQVFTQKWKRAEKAKSVVLKQESLEGNESLMLQAPQDPWEIMEQSLKIERVRNAIEKAQSDGTLTPREILILNKRFGLEDGINMSLEEVSKLFDVTSGRILQVEAKALEKLRGYFNDKYEDDSKGYRRLASPWSGNGGF